ncbi:sensor histidine kinase [Herminiimonas aquatilis]|uniref:histidine kinase n=1 Tax=Herminiimonas aquatilis TaxID=345342 RepID=A0ABW2J8S1_9BURK
MIKKLIKNRSFRTRIAVAFALMALAICTFFSVAAYLAVEISEEQLIDERLINDTNQLIDRHQNNIVGSFAEDNFYINEKIPELFRTLSDGVHEIEIDGNETTVFIRRVGSDIYASTNDTSAFEETEKLIFSAIAAGFITSLSIAIILGLYLSWLIVAPVTKLAAAVEKNEDCSELPSLDEENEIGTLARAFSRRSKKMQQFLADEKLFTGDVSHELRTPLTIMLGAAELLEVRLANLPEDLFVAKRITRVAAESAERVSALLLLSQSPEVLNVSQLLISHVVVREIDRYRQFLGEKPVSIEFDNINEDVWVFARNELAGIAIGNLIRNACQYTQQGIVRVTLRDDRIVIEDEGPGLPENVRVRLFARHVRGHGDEYVGSGLGLAIVKRVADHMGWTIEYESLETSGSKFTLFFPQVSTEA